MYVCYLWRCVAADVLFYRSGSVRGNKRPDHRVRSTNACFLFCCPRQAITLSSLLRPALIDTETYGHTQPVHTYTLKHTNTSSPPPIRDHSHGALMYTLHMNVHSHTYA